MWRPLVPVPLRVGPLYPLELGALQVKNALARLADLGALADLPAATQSPGHDGFS